MEIQIPLVIFTSFLAWSAGIFATQCVLAFNKRASEIQMPALLTSAVILIVGGIAVVFHLTHPFNIFNGFGHITSGITQELIAIVLLAVAMVLYFLMLRKSDDKTVPQWLTIVGCLLTVVLIVSMGHSYMMDSRPAWNSVLQLASLLGAACIMGPATIAIIGAVKDANIVEIGKLTLYGVCINAVCTIGYLLAMVFSGTSFVSFDYYFDPTHPNKPMINASDVSIFSGDALWALLLCAVALVVSVVAVKRGKDKDDWKTWGAVIAGSGLVCIVSLRVMMYIMGSSVFMLY